MSALRFTDRPSPNFDMRTRAIDLVVLHYTGMQDADTALARLTDPAPVAGKFPGPWQKEETAPDAPLPRVSTHYVVDETGGIFRIVEEEARAWHAGVSSWRGEGDVNSRAIGIEIVNGGHDFGLPDYPPAQVWSASFISGSTYSLSCATRSLRSGGSARVMASMAGRTLRWYSAR